MLSSRITCHPYCVCTGSEISPGLRATAAFANSGTYWPALEDGSEPEFCFTVGSIETCFANARKSSRVESDAVTWR
jgi:hypothetical protein